jgi:hypothetical protein
MLSWGIVERPSSNRNVSFKVRIVLFEIGEYGILANIIGICRNDVEGVLRAVEAKA